jgi:hypothetical protein
MSSCRSVFNLTLSIVELMSMKCYSFSMSFFCDEKMMVCMLLNTKVERMTENIIEKNRNSISIVFTGPNSFSPNDKILWYMTVRYSFLESYASENKV